MGMDLHMDMLIQLYHAEEYIYKCTTCPWTHKRKLDKCVMCGSELEEMTEKEIKERKKTRDKRVKDGTFKMVFPHGVPDGY